MASFFDTRGKGIFSNFSASLRKLSTLGMDYNDMIIDQSLLVGSMEGTLGMGIGDKDMMNLAFSDISSKKFIAFFEKDYAQKRDFLRTFAMNGEIEWILDTICDEAIVHDERNIFCEPFLLNLDLKDDMKDDIYKSFRRIYNGLNFSDAINAWQLFKQFLIDGTLAFEIIYDKTQKKIIGFKELDPVTLRPGIEVDSNGKHTKVWYQQDVINNKTRTVLDSHIIYISYAKGNIPNRISYCERLVRSFNLMRLMENSRVIWNIMNSSYRLKMIVPIGTKSPQKAKESLSELMNIYKEDVQLDFESGELRINGKPGMQFYKNYMFPSKNGESPEIETIGGDGPNLSDTEALKYFYDKLKLDSKIPFSRFEKEGGGGFSVDASSIDRDEIRFSRFINRLRSIFQEIILKPMLLQIQIDHPEVSEDENFLANIGLEFFKDNVFEEMKTFEIMEKRANFIDTMKQLKEDDEQTPYFSTQLLIDEYMRIPKSIIDKNMRYKQAKFEKEETPPEIKDENNEDEDK